MGTTNPFLPESMMFPNWSFHNEVSHDKESYRLVATSGERIVVSKWVLMWNKGGPRIEASMLDPNVGGYVEEHLFGEVQHVAVTNLGKLGNPTLQAVK